MSWLTLLTGLRHRRFPMEHEATAASVRASWAAEAMEEARRPRAEHTHPPVVFRWDGRWTRWSQLSHTFEPIGERLVPTNLIEFVDSLGQPPAEGDRFRFNDGGWARLAPDEPDMPPETTDSTVSDATVPADSTVPAASGSGRPDALMPTPTSPGPPPPGTKPASEQPAAPAADPVADQIAAWRRRIRR